MVPMSYNVGKESGWPESPGRPPSCHWTPDCETPGHGYTPLAFAPMTTVISSSVRWFSAPPVGAACGRRWLVALIVLLLATLVGAPARAAVPMCSEDGRTVA